MPHGLVGQAAEHAGNSSSQGAEEGGVALLQWRPFEEEDMSSSSPYLRATRPSSHGGFGGSAKRIGGGRARKCGKEGKPVVGG